MKDLKRQENIDEVIGGTLNSKEKEIKKKRYLLLMLFMIFKVNKRWKIRETPK